MWNIKLNPGQDLFFISDPHYAHKNICKGVSSWSTLDMCRPFKNLTEMNDTIVNNINNVVKPDDILICLGDWSFGGIHNVIAFRNRINCKNIYLILGNHDHHIEENTDNLRSLFVKVDYYTILSVQVNEKAIYEFVLSHYPIASWINMNKGMMHLFGHVHLPNDRRLMAGKSMDVGMEGNDMKPYSIKEIVGILQHQPNETTVIPCDHHKKEVR